MHTREDIKVSVRRKKDVNIASLKRGMRDARKSQQGPQVLKDMVKPILVEV